MAKGIASDPTLETRTRLRKVSISMHRWLYNLRVIKVWDNYHGFHKNIVLFSTLIIRNAS